jgi:hypothetical protein
MGRQMHRFWFALLLVVSFNLPMMAQTDNADLFGGYSLERIAPGCGLDYTCGSLNNIGKVTNLNGWIISATDYLHKSLGLSAQFTGDYNGSVGPLSESVHRYAYQFGPVYAFRWQHASVFAHALFGGVSQGSSGTDLAYTKFIWSVGGGLDLRVASLRSSRADRLREATRSYACLRY